MRKNNPQQLLLFDEKEISSWQANKDTISSSKKGLNCCLNAQENTCSKPFSRLIDTHHTPLSDAAVLIERFRRSNLSTPNTSETKPCKHKEFIGVSNKGIPVGEDSHLARYTNREVELVLALREEGLSYRDIAKKMEMPPSTVWGLVTGRFRATLVSRYKVKK